MFGAACRIQASATLRRLRADAGGDSRNLWGANDRAVTPTRAQWRERDEGDPPPGAFVQDGLGSEIGEVVGILDARYLGELHGAKQVWHRHVAEAHR
jgi:hypothetical protein